MELASCGSHMKQTRARWSWRVAGAAAVAALVAIGAPPLPRAATAAEAPPTKSKPRQQAPQKGLSPPGYLDQGLYELLHRRMQRHGADMTVLLNQVLLLRYAEVVVSAEHIATTPPLQKPGPGDMNDVEAHLPERFFLLQDQLGVEARNVTEAARARDDARLAAAFGRLTESCVSCHAVFRAGEPRRPGARP